MSVICPQCRHQRHANDTAPEWQCPACGIAYAKAAATESHQRPAAPPAEPRSVSWLQAIVIVVAALGAWQVLQFTLRNQGGITSVGADLSDMENVTELQQLARTVKSDEVMIYTTTDCRYCAQAKSWLTEYGFPYTECDAQVRSECARDLNDFGSNGVPYLIVRGKHLREGFDSDEFVAALRL